MPPELDEPPPELEGPPLEPDPEDVPPPELEEPPLPDEPLAPELEEPAAPELDDEDAEPSGLAPGAATPPHPPAVDTAVLATMSHIVESEECVCLMAPSLTLPILKAEVPKSKRRSSPPGASRRRSRPTSTSTFARSCLGSRLPPGVPAFDAYYDSKAHRARV
jgi:hypothetical protein